VYDGGADARPGLLTQMLVNVVGIKPSPIRCRSRLTVIIENSIYITVDDFRTNAVYSSPNGLLVRRFQHRFSCFPHRYNRGGRVIPHTNAPYVSIIYRRSKRSRFNGQSPHRCTRIFRAFLRILCRPYFVDNGIFDSVERGYVRGARPIRLVEDCRKLIDIHSKSKIHVSSVGRSADLNIIA